MTIEHPAKNRERIEYGVVGEDEDILVGYSSGNDVYYVVDGKIEHYGRAVYTVKETDKGLVTCEILGTPSEGEDL